VRPSVAALTEAFAALKAAGATELVLDLRYNGGGLVDVAVHLASLIGGARTGGQVMMNYVQRKSARRSTRPRASTTRPTRPEPAAADRDHDARVGAGERADQFAQALHPGGDRRRYHLRQAGRPRPRSATRCSCRCRSRRTSTTKAIS
jgi:hypothetical protein